MSTKFGEDLFSKVKKIKQSKKDIVYGYFKQIRNNKLTSNNGKNNIPELILFICLIYYYQFDILGKCCKDIIISGDDNNIIKKINNKVWVDIIKNKKHFAMEIRGY